MKTQFITDDQFRKILALADVYVKQQRYQHLWTEDRELINEVKEKWIKSDLIIVGDLPF